MKTDPTREAVPDSISPDDALTLALQSKSFAKHVLHKVVTKELAPDQAGASMHPEARKRHNAKMIRENKIKASELSRNHGSNNNTTNRTSYKPLWDGDQLRQRLQSYDRTPFLDLLAIWMECSPTPQTIMAFADKYPDRWTKAMVDLGRLGGFAEKKEIDFNFAAKVARMSDSQLEDQLREQAYRLGIPLPALLTMIGSGGHETSTRQQTADLRREAVDVVPEPAVGAPGDHENVIGQVERDVS